MTSASDPEFEGEHDGAFDELETRISQGDVIRFIRRQPDPSPQSSMNWSAHLGTIVTANCDLAHHKHGGILSYVPIVPINIYASMLAIPRIGEAATAEAMTHLRECLPVGRGWLTLERLLEMLWEGRQPEEIRKYLPTDARAEPLEAALREVQTCMKWEKMHESATNWQEILEGLADLLQNIRAARRHKAIPREELVKRELKGKLHKALPGDALFLAAPAPSTEGGFIAYLRLIREIPMNSIATSPVQERLEPNTIARRVGRLSPVYLHRLTQQMAAVFTDIGLPTRYEKNRDFELESAFDHWASQVKAST